MTLIDWNDGVPLRKSRSCILLLFSFYSHQKLRVTQLHVLCYSLGFFFFLMTELMASWMSLNTRQCRFEDNCQHFWQMEKGAVSGQDLDEMLIPDRFYREVKQCSFHVFYLLEAHPFEITSSRRLAKAGYVFCHQGQLQMGLW